MKTERWIPIKDSRVHSLWYCRNPKCMSRRIPHTVSPTWFDLTEIPICEKCDLPLEYSHTEIFQDEETVAKPEEMKNYRVTYFYAINVLATGEVQAKKRANEVWLEERPWVSTHSHVKEMNINIGEV